MSEPLVRLVTRHFECLGYSCTLQDDGWVLAEHPVRLNVAFRVLPTGVGLYCSVSVGRGQPDRDAWHAFLNRANDTSVLSRFAVGRADDGEFSVRVRALLPSKYDRKAFGVLVDAFQEDVALLRHAPPPAEEVEGDETDPQEEKPSVTVN